MQGIALWATKTNGLVPAPNFGQNGISYSRFVDIFEAVGCCKSVSNDAPVAGCWSMNDKLIGDFNRTRRDRFAAGCVLVLDESMIAWKPQSTAFGGLPNISFIPRKPEPLGTELKTVCCGTTGVMLHAEVQKGKDAMKEAALASEFRHVPIVPNDSSLTVYHITAALLFSYNDYFLASFVTFHYAGKL